MLQLLTFDELLDEPELKSGDRSGPWKYYRSPKGKIHGIEHQNGYFINFHTGRGSAGVLDWIIQLSTKGWVTDEELGQLVRLIDQALHCQQTLCGGGYEHETVR